jgi:hypothetical protein
MGIKKNVDILDDNSFIDNITIYFTEAGMWFEVKGTHVCVPNKTLPSLIASVIDHLSITAGYKDGLIDALQNTIDYLEGNYASNTEKIPEE